MDTTRKTASPRCLKIIKSFEGICDGDPTTVNLDPYLDPVGIWTIGWGHAIRANGRFLKGEADKAQAYALYPGGITLQQAEALLEIDVAPVELYLSAVLPALNQNQFDALCSFNFNEGLGNFEGSTLFKKLKAGDMTGAAAQFGSWIYSDHKMLDGLVNRRAAERILFAEQPEKTA
jgi:lysozyme